ncbi:cytochrome c biogenesis protein ResB [Ideonella margarita]|uniref:Cytochrome c biogenesis protein ResB n=1 Tax=Ideonella margarita TaxID=2984191 RepID=A0ABU9C2K8_9BURK
MSAVNGSATVLPLRPWRLVLDLLASMRFAISMLSIICIASVIGTLVKQNEPYNNYINQFGPFWAEVFGKFQLYNVYSAGWFLLILAFLVISTSLCIARNTPKILADLKTFKESVRVQSLKAFHHKGDGVLPLDRAGALAQVAAVLGQHGWKAKAEVREDGTMVAARAGRINKLGYIAAHSAIVLICLGGLFDGDLIVKAQMWFAGKTSFDGGGFIRDVAPEHRLSVNNPTFRGNLLVPEGARSGTAVLTMPDGVVLQDLPFDIELKKFVVDYYDTGMPKLFASEIVIHDHDYGESKTATVKVNEPVFHRGVAIYQSSFDDGGSKVKLQALPMRAGGKAFDIDSRVGDNTRLSNGNEQLTLEVTSLKVINVENMGGEVSDAVDVRKVDLGGTLNKHLGSGARGDKAKTLRNVGPAINYKLRDASGQAREFHNYMSPLMLDGQLVFLAGVRDSPADPFRYLRIPADERGSVDGWQRLRQALLDPELRNKAARQYAAMAAPADKPEMLEQLRVTGQRALALFAGDEVPPNTTGPTGGLVAFSQFIESTVPQAERARVSEVLLRILNGSLFELNQLAREQAGLKALEVGPSTETFMTQAVMSLSDSFFYPAPVMLQLAEFNQVQASVFQVARAPGKTLVYLGAVLLIIGVFAMLYVRERRLWVWLSDDPAQPGHTRALVAMSLPRRTLDLDAQFETLRQQLLAGSTPTGENP